MRMVDTRTLVTGVLWRQPRGAGRNRFVRLLLEHGADINAQLDGDYGSTLAAAAANVSKQIVPLLLEHGAEINAELSGGYGSALAAGGSQLGAYVRTSDKG